ncbi:MAG: phospho-sugar mutase [Firmicutes bacterium]|nr:phospho-sugar mutase [Bacillota bacterium]
MEYLKHYDEWRKNSYFDKEFIKELESIKDDQKEIQDRFYKDLEFGTGGMRGIIGAGRNRMNIYNVRKATQGLANYINNLYGEKSSVVIAYDSRIMSKEFAMESALVLGANGIKAYLFEDIRTTPELSFSVRELGAQGGIVITASHNPSEYNGYKVYGADGGQLIPEFANKLVDEVSKIKNWSDIKYIDEFEALEMRLLNYVGKNIDKVYFDRVVELSINKDVFTKGKLKLLYTPLHGTGGYGVTSVYSMLGYKIDTVKKQMVADGNFPTVEYPNPEELKAFDLAIKMAKENGHDIIIATDPDCDRVGIVVKGRDGEFVPLNGNQIGALLLNYILENKKVDDSYRMIKTIVTSDLGKAIAEDHGVETIDTLTGFKFIADKIEHFKDEKFLFGYEESYGYLYGDFVRDKDGIITSMLVGEMALYYAEKDKNLLEVLDGIYKKYGYYKEGLKSIVLKGKEGMDKIARIMEHFIAEDIKEVSGSTVLSKMDILNSKEYLYSNGKTEDIMLPKSKVVKYKLENNGWVAIRPSGTEPKLKIYASVNSDNLQSTEEKLNNIMNDFAEMIDKIE